MTVMMLDRRQTTAFEQYQGDAALVRRPHDAADFSIKGEGRHGRYNRCVQLFDFMNFKTTFTIFIVLLIICICDRLFLPHPSWLSVIAAAVMGVWSLVLFVSDNGPLPTFDRARTVGLRGSKLSLYEGGVRVPCIAWAPALVKALSSNAS